MCSLILLLAEMSVTKVTGMESYILTYNKHKDKFHSYPLNSPFIAHNRRVIHFTLSHPSPRPQRIEKCENPNLSHVIGIVPYRKNSTSIDVILFFSFIFKYCIFEYLYVYGRKINLPARQSGPDAFQSSSKLTLY